MLSTADEKAEFGDHPWLLYAYTVLSSVLTVPFSQPVVGQWTAVRAYMNGELTRIVNLYLIEVTTSAAATALIAWYVLGRRRPEGARRYREPVPLAACAVLVASAGLSYAYAKSEIMSSAGVLYALTAYAAAAEALPAMTRKPLTTVIPALAVIAVICGGWGVRSVGLQYKLQRAAFEARREWVLRMPPYRLSPSRLARLTPRLRQEALLRSRANPLMLPRRAALMWER